MKCWGYRAPREQWPRNSWIVLSPVRRLVADDACISKSKDFRLVFCAEKNLLELANEEKCDLESLLSNVDINENVKGGLHWPHGSTCSTSTSTSTYRFMVVGTCSTSTSTYRLKVVGSCHKKQTNVNMIFSPFFMTFDLAYQRLPHNLPFIGQVKKASFISLLHGFLPRFF